MAEFDPFTKKLTLKLVYYGPALSGKTTNLIHLHDVLAPSKKGQIMALETQNDRTLFFDLFPMGFTTPGGALIKLKLFTVPGQVAHDSTRKAVLSRADGVVFVADSQLSQGINNNESFENLADNLERLGLNIETLPLAVQFNKRDLPHIISEEDVLARWQTMPWPVVFATATHGEGVRETFEQLLRLVYRSVHAEYPPVFDERVTEKYFLENLGIHT